MQIWVFHATKDAHMFRVPAGYVPNVMADYAHVATVDTASLDVAYERTNTINAPWWTNDGVTFHGSPDHGMKGARSTSVGDVMVTREGETYRTYMVAGCGFEEVTDKIS